MPRLSKVDSGLTYLSQPTYADKLTVFIAQTSRDRDGKQFCVNEIREALLKAGIVIKVENNNSLATHWSRDIQVCFLTYTSLVTQ